MEYPIHQVDAFTSRCFHGNPAAVVVTKQWLPVETMQAIAAEKHRHWTCRRRGTAAQPAAGADR
jgi:predicted PhzF superfamily epimerase YddE/YHI9